MKVFALRMRDEMERKVGFQVIPKGTPCGMSIVKAEVSLG